MTGGIGDDRFYLRGSSTELSGTKHFAVTTGSGNDYVDAGGVGSLVENDAISITTGEGVNTIVVDGTKKVNIILGIAETYRDDVEPENIWESEKLIESRMYNYHFNIHYAAYEKELDFVSKSDIGGFFVCGTTGEFISLSPAENKEMLKFAMDFFGGKKKAFSGRVVA